MFVVVAIVIFGIFVSLAYTVFGSEGGLSSGLENLFTDSIEQTDSLFEPRQYYIVEDALPSPEEYFVFSDGTITDYIGPDKDIVIPYEIAGKTVKTLGNTAFLNKGLTSVLIPNTVKDIQGSGNQDNRNGTFTDNKLTEIHIPDSVRNIGEWAFHNNQLQELTLPNSVKTLGAGAFRQNKIEHLTMSKNVKNIEWATFYGNNLETLVIPEGVESLGKGAFMVNSIVDVEIPDSVTHILEHAFSLNKFTDFTVPRTVKHLGFEFIGRNTQLTELNLPLELKPFVEENRGSIINGITYVYGETNGYTIHNYFDETDRLNYY